MAVTIVRQHALADYLPLLAQWRLTEFAKFPYLYSGDEASEDNYAQAFARTNRAFMAIDRDESGYVLGILTCAPLTSEKSLHGLAQAELFREQGHDPDEWFYLGEAIVVPSQRHRGTGKLLVDAAEKEISRMGYLHVCFLCVDRPTDHSLRPADYQSPDGLWERMGFHRLGFSTSMKWPTHQPDGSVAEQENPMIYWGR